MRFYRFRSLNGLLGDFKELETQSIYFASRDQLNDPMEGFRDFFWQGDAIIWRNLFRHYLLCLDRAYARLALSRNDDPNLWKLPLPVRESLEDLPAEYRARFARVERRFFSMEVVASLLAGLIASDRTVHRHELRFYLQYAHYCALEACIAVAGEDGLLARERPLPIPRDLPAGADFFSSLSSLLSKPARVDNPAEVLFQYATQVQAQSELIYRVSDLIDPGDHRKNLLVLDFPERYLTAVETLAFPPWYTACFMSECTNSSVWGNYGVNHTGMCLVFESLEVDGQHYLPLTGYNSVTDGVPRQGPIRLPFERVRYAERYAKLDFFRLLGGLPPPALQSMWYRDEHGNLSRCASHLLDDQDAWRKQYWASFEADVLRKTKDWAYENEHRLVLHQGTLIDYSIDAHRTLTYDFSSLHGIIFGIRTATEEKAKIVRIVHEKCIREARSDFAFYQAHYSPESGTIEHAPLRLLRLRER